MGSATTQALAAQAKALDATTADLDTARELFAAARAVAGSASLSGALADASAPADARSAVAAKVFADLSPATRQLIDVSVQQRWSRARDLADGIEELAVRVTAKAEQADVEGELFRVLRIVAGDAELELALGSRLGDPAAKGALIESLFAGRVSAGTALILTSLVQLARGRRVRALLNRAMRITADQRGRAVATVLTAAPLDAAQTERLAAALSRTYGADVRINTVIDPAVVGGIRVQVADDVIDGSISSRLADLRQKLVG